MNIIYILLVVATIETPWDYSQRIVISDDGAYAYADTTIVDEWGTMISHGDYSTVGTSHYKAILFKTTDALERYLSKNNANGCTLIDVKNGKIFTVRQVEHKKPVQRTEEVFDYYEWWKGK